MARALWEPAAAAAPSWERGSSYPDPATAAPLLVIYIPEKEPPWPRPPGEKELLPSRCLQPCSSAWGPPQPRQRDNHWPCTNALNAPAQQCRCCPGTAVPAAAPPSLALFLAAVSFPRRSVACSGLPCLRLPRWAAPVPARAWALPRVPARAPGSSRERHRPCRVVLHEEEPAPVLLRGQGLPCAASHRRGQEVSVPITMGLCALSALLSTDLVQFCTVFSRPGQPRTRSQSARRLPRTPECPHGCHGNTGAPGPTAAGLSLSL